jgi:SAM-dependent methyltransferase
MKLLSPPSCSPVSSSIPLKILDLPRARLLTELSRYFNSPIPSQAIETDYSLWRCSETGLEFSWPLSPGNPIFYDWISQFPAYYPSKRWEYTEVVSQVRDANSSQASVLDVGCGSGSFLDLLSFLPTGRAVGLDFNDPAVLECKKKSLTAFKGSIRQALSDGLVKPNQFNFVTSFHCLEHVACPLEFVQDLLSVTSRNGRVFLSTPVSPMSFESAWFDVMNHPPHHMTRWTLPAYQKIASILKLDFSYFLPSVSPVRQALSLENLKIAGPNSRPLQTGNLFQSIQRLPGFLASWIKMSYRAKNHPLKGADVILVQFSRK